MSATPGRGRGRVKIEGETKTQQLVRVAGGRVTKLFKDMELVGNLGAMIREAANQEGVNADAVIQQIWNAFAAEASKLKARLETGERAKEVFELKV